MFSILKLSVLLFVVFYTAAATQSTVPFLDSSTAKIGEHNYQALILKVRETKTIPHCGGVIVSNRHVLTVASCLQGLTTKTVSIAVGDLKNILSVKSIKIHESFANGLNNIAIVEVEKTFDFTKNISKITLETAFVDNVCDSIALGFSLEVSFSFLVKS